MVGNNSDAPASQSIGMQNAPSLIRVYDEYGREFHIPKEQWRTEILPGAIRSRWNDADQLYGVIVTALNDGFAADILKAAEQLHRIDPDRARGACVYAIALMNNDRLDESERVLRSHLEVHGDEGSVLTNLAKVYAAREQDQQAQEVLWHALEVDPNQDNGLGWYEAIHRERGGEGAGQDALRRVAALPGSWRAQMGLARAALRSGALQNALAYYEQSLSHVGDPVPTDLLMQLSGDLGNHGYLSEILRLAEPRFVPAIHGLYVGNNLIKVHLELGELEAARRILDKLYALKRPDWNEHLSYWDQEIAKRRVASETLSQSEPLNMGMVLVEGPVWLKSVSLATELFPAKPSDAPVVCFLGSSAETGTIKTEQIQNQLTDAPGRMSRSLPLFLAEKVEFAARAHARTMVPWVVGEGGGLGGGFVLAGMAWGDANAIAYCRQSGIKSEYVVTIHLKAQTEPWTVELRLIHAAEAKCLGNLSTTFSLMHPADAILGLAQQLLRLLTQRTNIEAQVPSPLYQVPPAEYFSHYLVRLEQLLAVRCGTMDHVPSGFIYGEREVITGNLQLSLAVPESVSVRILLMETLLSMKKIRPDILPEFEDRIRQLQKERPLPEPANGVVQRLLNEVFVPIGPDVS